MSTITPPRPQTLRVKVTGRNTITLPAELRAALGIKAGDDIEIVLNVGTAVLKKAPTRPVAPPPENAVPPLEGLMSDYFTDWDDVNRFVEEERRGKESDDLWRDPAEAPLRDHFTDWEDINRFVEEERRGWNDRTPDSR